MTESWTPEVLGIATLDERYAAYLVPAPFDMTPGASELIGTKALVGRAEQTIRGVLSCVPSRPIRGNEAIALLLRVD